MRPPQPPPFYWFPVAIPVNDLVALFPSVLSSRRLPLVASRDRSPLTHCFFLSFTFYTSTFVRPFLCVPLHRDPHSPFLTPPFFLPQLKSMVSFALPSTLLPPFSPGFPFSILFFVPRHYNPFSPQPSGDPESHSAPLQALFGHRCSSSPS